MWIPDLADADRMATLLAPHAAALGLRGGLGACRLVDVRLSNPHLPGTPRCQGWATYVLEPADPPTDVRSRPWGHGAGVDGGRPWYLEAHATGAGGPAWAASAAARPASPARFLPDLDVVAWPFPADPGLPLLGELLDPRGAQRHLPPGTRRGGRASGAGPTVVDVGVVRYQPRASAVLRVRLDDGTAVFAKLVDTGAVDVAAIAATHAALWERAHAEGPLRVAEPLGADPGRGLLWTREVAGPGLPAGLDAGTAAALAADVAALTADLHASGVGPGPAVDLAALADEARKKVAKMAVAHPAAAERLAGLLHRAPALTTARPAAVTVHGDLHVDQLVLTPAGPVLLDLDSVTTGPPELDLAELVVDLVLRRPGPDVLDRFVPRLLAGYADAAGPRAGSLDPDLLTALADAEFVNRCYRHLRRHLPGWTADLERELDEHPRVVALLRS
jgi:hypothetical protein